MLSIQGHGVRLCDGFTRREVLRVGGLTAFGLSLPHVLAAREAQSTGAGNGYGRAKACIVLWMAGGPPQHETWDPKPDAPAEVRGPFGSIATSVPGLRVGELMPRSAAICHKLCVIRSLATNNPGHASGNYEMLTGMEHPAGKGNEAIKAERSDFPYFGSVVKRLRRPKPGVPTTVVYPQRFFNVPFYPGQDAGWLGTHWDPVYLSCDPAAAHFQIEDLAPRVDLPVGRLTGRCSLLQRIDEHFDRLQRGPAPVQLAQQAAQAFDLLSGRKVGAVFDLDREPQAVRDRYGRHAFGQGCLLARRLVEAGVALVQLNWPREPNNDLSHSWDFHAELEKALKGKMPIMDQGYTALLEDLEARGLLDETLVVWAGEMGRTPKLEYVRPNPAPGRNHWGNVFSLALAGAGVRGGQVYGSSDRNGAYPKDKPVGPQDFTATLFHALGLPPTMPDRLNRPVPISRGRALHELFA
jgi:hypothetical protein